MRFYRRYARWEPPSVLGDTTGVIQTCGCVEELSRIPVLLELAIYQVGCKPSLSGGLG